MYNKKQQKTTINKQTNKQTNHTKQTNKQQYATINKQTNKPYQESTMNSQ